MAERSSTATHPLESIDVPPLSHWLARACSRHAADPAVIAGDRQISYAQLAEMVAAERDRLAAAGAQPSDRVAIAATRSVETIVAILACVDAGVGYVPLDLSYPAERLAAMLEASRPRLVLGEADALEQLRGSVPEFPTLDRPAPPQAVHAAEQDLTYVLFTSGSTGKPKGVAMGALPLRHLIAWHAAHPRLGQSARTLQFAPLSFDVHFQEILSTVACGGALVLLSDAQRRDPSQLHAAIVEHGVQRLFLPYVALQMLAEASRERPPQSLREVVSAGEQLQVTPAIRAMFRALPDAQLHNHYGPTESHVVTAHELVGDAAGWPEIPPIGQALPHVRLALANAEIEAGAETGELLLGGETLAHGYIGREDLTAERFREDPAEPGHRWYVTGDLVRRDADGVVTYLGRADDQVKVDGFRIEPGEIELALMRHPAVRDAVVTAPVIPGAGRQLVAHLVLREPADDLPAALRSHLRGQVPDYMVPVRYVVLDRLPTTPSGKINRRGLPLPEPEPAPTAGADPAEMARELWCQLLGVSSIAPDQNLFDLGARSLMVLRFVARLRELGIDRLSVTDIYDRPTLRGITERLRGGSAGTRTARGRATQTGQRGSVGGIAIVGMAARAGDAADVEQLWQQLVAGKESLRRFGPDEIDPAVPAEMRQRPNFVAARGVLENAARFDAGFFGISAREAVLIDPQQRLLLELCWTALEQAGIDPSRRDGRVGVYAGTANNSYITSLRDEQPELIQQAGEFAAMLASEKDYVATRIAHRLDLDGPAVSVHTACSTGLVAVAQAWHALASGQCDVALAGGATVVVPQHGGYLHVEGGMESADGRCRPFDAEASGTVFGSGGAVVVLKRLEDALADGDHIHAVIRGVGLNNDGADKASFTAPSVSGQAGAIVMALEAAGVDPRSIGYVEAHGTGTALGDPIEVAALTRAWREYTSDSSYCLLGSAKGHLGHTVAAAGVFGLIKAALSLEHELIPATLHYRAPNPQIDFAATPFVPVTGNTAWPRVADKRRAAVSSFGVGGTNAHVILEEAPAAPAQSASGGGMDDAGIWLLPVSARSADAVLRRANALADHLEANPSVPLSRVLATLVRGRQPMAHRLSVVARDAASAAAALRAARSSAQAATAPRVVLLFPGQGSQHPGMVRGLYDEIPAFRTAFDACLEQLARHVDAPWRAWLVEADPADVGVAEKLSETRYAQPALFSVSYALAAWLESLGIEPDAMIGHSIGEYAAACRAGVFGLDAAIAAVVARGQAMFEQPRGAMLAVQADAQRVAAMMPAGVEIAGCNAPALTVVAGSHEPIAAFAAQLAAQEIGTTSLKVSHAFHSASMEGALPAIERALGGTSLAAPRRTVYSCVSGAALRADEACSPAYWARQVRAPVRFDKAVLAELTHADTVFIEVGPGQALTALLRQYRTAEGKPPRVVPLLGRASVPGEPAVQALTGLGAAWCAGVAVRWPVPAGAPRATLPTYPFQGQDYWFKRKTFGSQALAAASPPSRISIKVAPTMSRIPNIEHELAELMSGVSGLPASELAADATFLDLGLDSLSLTQATLEIERVFGVKMRFRRLLEDLDSIGKLARQLDTELPADKFAPAPATPAVEPMPASAAVAPAATVAALPAPTALPMAAAMPAIAAADGGGLQALLAQQLQVMSQQLSLLGGAAVAAPAFAAPAAVPASAARPVAAAATTPAPAAAAAVPAAMPEGDQPGIKALVEKPFGASARITLERKTDMTSAQSTWLQDFIARYNARTGKSKSFSQDNRRLMADPRVVTGFNPQWKDLVYPIVVNRSKGARLWDLDGNEYIDLLSCFGANLLGYQPDEIVDAMVAQLQAGIEVGPQHPLAADVARLMSEITGMERIAFCNTGSEAVMGAMRIARTVTGRKTIAIFTNSYHGIFDEVIVRGTKQLRSLSAAPGILANAVENVLVLDWNSEESLRVLRERGRELAAIMTEPIQNKYPTIQPREFVQSLRQIADEAGCALIFDEVVTGFRVAPGGAQEFYGVRADIATYGKIIGGGLPFAAIGGSSKWLDALDGGHWQYGDDSYPEAGVTYFAGTFVRHPLALAAAHASLLHLKRGGHELYRSLNDRTQRFIDRLNTAFAARGAPVKAVHCASLWRLSWDDDQKYISLFYYLVRYHGLHLYEQFGHFVTEAMGEPELERIFSVFTNALDELMALGFITPRPGGGGSGKPRLPESPASTPASGTLAPGQTERWLAASFDHNALRALNESFCVSLRGNVNLPALKQALADVLKRHPAMRLSFDDAEPRQTVGDEVEPALAEVDLRSHADADAALDEFCTRAGEREFALDAPPLAAASLLHLSDGRVVVHMVASHLVFDGWASSVFNAELAATYRARCSGVAPQFPPAESPVRFAEEANRLFAGPDGQAAVAYWSGVLKNPPAPLMLGDRTPPAARRFTADTVRARIDGELLVQMRARARAQGATLFQWLLTSVAVMINKRSGREDFVVSIPYAAQSLMRLGPLLGDGVLDLPLRMRCAAGDSRRDMLARVKSSLMDAMEHPQMTQGTAARALGLRAEGNRPPLTGVFFNLNPKVDLSGWAPLQPAMHEGRKRGLLSEVFFNFYEQQDAITLDVHYSTEYFSPERIGEVMRDLVVACLDETAAAALPPAVPEPAERPQAAATAPVSVDARLLQWNATDRPLVPGDRVELRVARQAAATPDAVAVVVKGEQITYRELQSRANRFAQVLASRGIGPGALVGLCLDRNLDLVPALLGVLQTGAAYVPLDPGFPRDRLRMMAEDAALPLVVTQAAHAELAGLPREKQLRIDDDAAVLAAAPAVALPARSDGEVPAYVIYTSGSTGKPKGVAVPQRAVCNFLTSMQREPGLRAGDTLLAVTTLSFDIAVLELLLPLVTGARVVLADRDEAMDGEALAAMIAERCVNVMQATPTTWHLLLDAGWRAPSSFRALCGGEPLPPALASALLAQGVELWNLYGPTETTVWSTLTRITDAAQKISIGRPIDNTQVWILDEQLQPLGVGAEGEICIGGDGVALGYFKRPELTADRFVRLPFGPRAGPLAYRTGDLGRWREDGTLEHLGRLDFQVKLRGYRIELGEIEARLEQAEGVARAVVVAREVAPGDLALVGYVVPRAGVALDTNAIRDGLRSTLPDYMLPRAVLVLASLPLLPNGKIDRKSLPAPALRAEPPAAVAAAGVEGAAEATGLTRQIGELMGKVLGCGMVGPNQNFFELGGHSLLAAKLATALKDVVGHRPGLRVIFESPTPARLAVALDSGSSAASQPARAPIVHRPDQTQAPLTVMQERIRFVEEMHPGRTAYNAPSGHRLRGELDLEAFRRAFRDMVRRQPSLRTAIERTEAGVVQRVHETGSDYVLPLVDLGAEAPQAREARLNAALSAMTDRTFDLGQAPLFDATLFRLAADDHVLFFMTHHIVWDGWSFDVFYAEISELYEAYRTGRAPALAPLSITYGDYAQWHGEWLKSKELRDQIEAWKKQFSPEVPLAHPVGDYPRDTALEHAGGTARLDVGKARLEELRALAKRAGTTTSIVILAVYGAMMSDWLGNAMPAIGVPVRGRGTPELDAVMGFFNNMLPVRFRVDRQASVMDWVRSVHHTMVAAYGSQEAPFELLAGELEASGGGTAPVLYQAMFSYQDARARQTRWGNLAHERIPLPHRGTTEDLNLWMVELEDSIEAGLQYNADLFLPETASRLSGRFLSLLQAAVTSPGQSLSDLLAASDADMRQVGVWADDANRSKQGQDFLSRIEQAAQASPQQIAIRAADVAVSCGELAERVNAATRRLRDAGVTAGVAVRLQIDDLVEHTAYALAAWRLGAAVAAGTSPVKVCVQEPEYIVRGKAGQPGGVTPRRELTGPEAGEASIGSLDRAAIAQLIDTLAAQVKLLPGDRALCFVDDAPAQRMFTVIATLAAGGEVFVAPSGLPAEPSRLASTLRDQGIAWMQASGATWRSALAGLGSSSLEMVALVDVTELGADLARQLLDKGCTLVSTYRPHALMLPLAAGLVRDERECMVMGKPLIAGALDVLAGDGRRVPITVTSSLRLNLPGVEPVTGSLARWRADGVLQYLGESGAVAHVEGRRVDLDRLVAAVRALPGVAAAAAIVRDDPVLNRCIVVGVEPAPGAMQDDAHWETSVAALLDGVTSFRTHVGPLPRRADGSADPAALLVRRRAAASEEQALTPTQRVLVEVWQEVLRVKDVGLQDNFFELGGTSLGAMQVSQQLEQRLGGRRVSPRRFVFETLGQLAAAFDELEPMVATEPAVTVIEKSPVAANSTGMLSRLRRLVVGS